MANQREINDMLKEPVGDMPSMADLEAELAELDGPVPVPETSKPVQALNFPAVPSAAIQTKTVRSKSVMEQQLAALEAL